MDTLRLPEKYRNRVDCDAPEEMKAVRFKARFARKKQEFLVAAWPLNREDCWQIFVYPIGAQHEGIFWLPPIYNKILRQNKLQYEYYLKQLARQFVSSGAVKGWSMDFVENFSVSFDLDEITLKREKNDWHYRDRFLTSTIFSSFEVLLLPEKEVRARFLEAMETNEIVRTAWEWFNTDKPERREFFRRCENGDWTQIKAQLELLSGVCAAKLEKYLPLEWDWQNGRFRRGAKIPFPFLENWNVALRDFYKPRFLLRKVKEIATLGETFLPEFCIEKREFSGHEKLEAMLQLSHWAKTHFPARPELLEFPQ